MHLIIHLIIWLCFIVVCSVSFNVYSIILSYGYNSTFYFYSKNLVFGFFFSVFDANLLYQSMYMTVVFVQLWKTQIFQEGAFFVQNMLNLYLM